MLDEHFKELLNNNWSKDEIEIIDRIMKGLVFFKKLIPNSLKTDIVSAIKLCNELKSENEKLKIENELLKVERELKTDN